VDRTLDLEVNSLQARNDFCNAFIALPEVKAAGCELK